MLSCFFHHLLKAAFERPFNLVLTRVPGLLNMAGLRYTRWPWSLVSEILWGSLIGSVCTLQHTGVKDQRNSRCQFFSGLSSWISAFLYSRFRTQYYRIHPQFQVPRGHRRRFFAKDWMKCPLDALYKHMQHIWRAFGIFICPEMSCEIFRRSLGWHAIKNVYNIYNIFPQLLNQG